MQQCFPAELTSAELLVLRFGKAVKMKLLRCKWQWSVLDLRSAAAINPNYAQPPPLITPWLIRGGTYGIWSHLIRPVNLKKHRTEKSRCFYEGGDERGVSRLRWEQECGLNRLLVACLKHELHVKNESIHLK